MKKVGIAVVLVLIGLIVYYSGWLENEVFIDGLQKGLKGTVDLLGKGIMWLVDRIKSLVQSQTP